MSILSKKIDGKISQLKSEYKINRGISHQGTKGGFNENELSSLIAEVIPTKYKIANGIIENSGDEQSNETDIIIYDDEILPPYIQKDLSFIPVEAVKYIFEVKSTLTSTELKTTIQKFSKFKSIGGNSPSVLFSYSTDINGNELSRYHRNESEFFVNPSITVLCVSGKCYYYKYSAECYLKDFISNEEWLRMCGESIELNIEEAIEDTIVSLSNNQFLEKLNRAEFAKIIQKLILLKEQKKNLSKFELTINGIKFNDMKFKVHKWVGIEQEEGALNNDIELYLLSGISNTLSKKNFGSYLLNNKNLNFKTYAICYEDMWGNLSCQDFNKNGIDYNVDKASFTYESNDENNTHKMIFELKKPVRRNRR